MGLEEQQEEREVLGSIFPDEITDISDTAYRISIDLEAPTSSEDDPPPPLLLSVTYPPTYPDVAPHLDITNPPNAPRHPYLDLSVDKPYLSSSLESTITDSLGVAMVFTLVTTLKETAELLVQERTEAAAAVKAREAQKVEEEENRKFVGEVVTRERFLVWRDGFRKEMDDEEEKRKEADEEKRKGKGASKGEEKKLTGRQMWESGLGGKEDHDAPAEAQDEMVQKVEGIKIAA